VLGQLQWPPGEWMSKMAIKKSKTSKMQRKQFFKWGAANQLHKVHTKFHKLQQPPGEWMAKNSKKNQKLK